MPQLSVIGKSKRRKIGRPRVCHVAKLRRLLCEALEPRLLFATDFRLSSQSPGIEIGMVGAQPSSRMASYDYVQEPSVSNLSPDHSSVVLDNATSNSGTEIDLGRQQVNVASADSSVDEALAKRLGFKMATTDNNAVWLPTSKLQSSPPAQTVDINVRPMPSVDHPTVATATAMITTSAPVGIDRKFIDDKRSVWDELGLNKEPDPVTPSAPTPNLVPVVPNNWNNFIPVGVTPAAGNQPHLYEGAYFSDQTLYFTFAWQNIGDAAANGLALRFEISGVGEVVQNVGSLQPGQANSWANDWSVSPLPAGTYTFRVWLDHLDTIAESNEIDNYVERTITVLPAGSAASQLVSIQPFGVSQGVSQFRIDSQINQLGAELSYAVDLQAGQRLTVSAQTPESGGQIYANSTPANIADNGTIAASQIVVPNNGPISSIADLDVYVTIDHRNDADLDIFLVSPNGTRIELSTDNGGVDNGYLSTVFDDEAQQSITSARAPFYARYRPETSLSVLDGSNPAGTWRLEVSDDTANSLTGTLLTWALILNQGLDPNLRIISPDGTFLTASQSTNNVSRDATITSLTVPSTGRYTIRIGNDNLSAGRFTLEGGIYDSTVRTEVESPAMNIDTLRYSNGNISLLGTADGVGQDDVYAITLNAGEAVNIAASTLGGFYAPQLQVTGPNGFDAGQPFSGPNFDTVHMFTAAQSGTYTITVSYPFTGDFRNVVSTGNYLLTVSLSDTANNNSLPTARPIASFDYSVPVQVNSVYMGLPGYQGLWRGTITPTADVDVFSIGRMTPGKAIGIYVQPASGSQLFSSVALIDATGTIQALSQPLRYPGYEGISLIETVIATAGEYYVAVTGDATIPGGTVLSTGAYELFYADYGTQEDSYEQNDSKAQVDAAVLGASNSPRLGAVNLVKEINGLSLMEDSEDWFSFSTSTVGSRGDYVRIAFNNTRGNINLDVLDANGTLVRRSQGLGDSERVSLQGLVAGTYYARVWGQGGSRNPSYSLRIQSGSPSQRLISAPYTTDSAYAFSYQIGTTTSSTNLALQSGANELVVTQPSGGALPFKFYFDVQRVGSMIEQASVQYDTLGNVSRRTDALGRDTIYQHDALGQLVAVDGPQGGDATTYQYDANGNLTQMVDESAGTTKYEYDELNRLTKIIQPNGLGNILYGYDSAGHVTSLTYPNGSVVNYAYNSAGQLRQVIDGTNITSYTYNAAGQIATMVMPNAVVATYGYDQYGRLIDLAYRKADSSIVTWFLYTLDANGNRTSMEVRRPNAATPDILDYLSSIYIHGYDSLNRLNRVVYPDSSVVLYSYDDNYNRTSTSIDPDGPGPQSAVIENYQYGYDNRLDRITNAVGDTVKQYYYDPHGNVSLLVTPTDTTRYEYDYRNLLIVVENSTSRSEYFYDGNGDRIRQNVNGFYTDFSNDVNREHTEVISQTNEFLSNTTRYVYGAGRISSMRSGDLASVYYVADSLGSTYALTDSAGAIARSFNYSAFGALRLADSDGASSIVDNPFLFAGEAFQHDTELLYLRARYYDSATGRMISKDPIGLQGGTNAYAYALANPTNKVDPSGLDVRDIAAGYADAATLNFTHWLREKVGVDSINYDSVDYQNSFTATQISTAIIGTASLAKLGWSGLSNLDLSSLSKIAKFVRIESAKGDLNFGAALRVGKAGVQASWERSLHYFAKTGMSEPHLALRAWTGVSGAKAYSYQIPKSVLIQGAKAAASIGSLLGLSSSSPTVNRGGVLLDQAATFVGNLDQITKVTYDPVTDQLILVGGGGGSIPDLRLDDFVAAVRAVYGSAEDPGVTIDPQTSEPNNQLVHLFGGLEGTALGYTLFEADRVMKSLAARKDNITGQPVGSNVPGYKSMLDRWVDRIIATRGHSTGNSSRFWFVPNDVKLIRSADGQSFTFDRAAVKLMTENNLIGNGVVDPDAQDFANWFNANFAAIAAENYPYPSNPDFQHSFQRLEQAAKTIAFVRFLYDNDIPIDFSWIDNYQTQAVTTPATTPTVSNSRQYVYIDGSIVVGTQTISGGVAMETPNIYVDSATGLQNLILGSRPNELTQQFTTTINGQTETAVALSLNTGFVDGITNRADVDLAYKTNADVPFALVRFYNSSDTRWELTPAEMEFTRPEFYSSSRAPAVYKAINGLHEGEVRIVDRTTGQVRTFVSSLETARPSGSFAYAGLGGNGVPTFFAGGTEKPDGSSLSQEPGTLRYTLTLPDGTRQIFDRAGKLLQLIDIKNRAVTYSYASGRLSTITDPTGQVISISYDGAGRLVQATGLGGETVTYTYSSDGLANLIEADRMRGGIHARYSYTYNATNSADDDHRINSVITPDRVVESKTLSDILGRASRVEDARKNTFQQTFDPKTRTTFVTDLTDSSKKKVQTDSLGRTLVTQDELGRTTQMYYDVTRVFGAQYPGGWTFIQNVNGTNRQPSLIKLPDPARPWIYVEYDAKGNPIKLEDIARGGDANRDGIDDHPILMEYDSANNVTKVTDARGIVTTFAYEKEFAGTPQERLTSRMISKTEAFGTPRAATTNWQYEAATGLVKRQIDPTGVTIDYAYDNRGNVLSTVVALGIPNAITTSFTYDQFSRQTSSQDGMGRRVELEYNGWDQVTTTRLVGTTNLESHSIYDAGTGRKQADIDFLGHRTNYAYDIVTGDLISQTMAAGTVDESSMSITYDRFGNVQSVRDPVNNVTTFQFDQLKRPTGHISLGSSNRVVSVQGSNAEIVVHFSFPINPGLIDNGVDVFVKRSNGTAVPGSFSLSLDGLTGTWTANSTLVKDTYQLTLLASSAGQFTGLDGRSLDGEYFGALPSGNNTSGGDFVYSWFVDDHGNDSLHATTVAIPSSTSGLIELQGDQDWFRFEGIAGSRLRVDVVLGTQSGGLLDSQLTLVDGDGKSILAFNDDIPGRSGSRIDYAITRSGTYYLKVNSNGFTGAYQLDVNRLGDDFPDQTPGTSVSVPSTTAAVLEVGSDRDTFAFNAIAGRTYRITTNLLTLADSVLTVINQDGSTELATNDDFYAGNRAAYLYWTAPANGVYNIRVSSHNAQFAGTYELALSIDDHGDQISQATALPLNTDVNGNLEVKQDGDWFAFSAVAGKSYRLETNSVSLPDPFLALFSSTQLLAANDNYLSPNSAIFWQAPTSGTYYLKVTGHDGTGLYKVRATELVDDFGNSAAFATAILVPSETAGRLEVSTDSDWFSFQVITGRRYRLETSLGTLGDSLITAYASDGSTVVGQNDDYRGPRSRLDFTATSTGRMYASVSSPGGAYEGSYVLSLIQLEDVAPIGTLVDPIVGSVLGSPPSYVDVAWSDGNGSGIDLETIDSSDVSVTGATVVGIENRGSGVWRYRLEGGSNTGPIIVSLLADHVSDLHGNWNALQTFTFNYANQPPTDINLSGTAVPENSSAGSVVGTFSTLDPDAGNTFVYTLVPGVGGSDNATFTVTGATLTANSSLDFETKGSYVVRVRSTDQGGLFIEKTFTITVTDINEAPIDIALSPSTIPENAGTNVVVGSLATTDPDIGNSFTYSFVQGAGSTDNGKFTITGNTLSAITSFDFETQNSYSIRVRSTDQNGLFTEKALTITVVDVNESPTDIRLSNNSLGDNAGPNAVVGTLSTIDPDASNTFTYGLVAGAGATDNSLFNISGQLLRATSGLPAGNYSVRVRTTDQGALSFEKSFSIVVTNVNLAPTDIALSSTSIAENAGANAVVGLFSTIDPNTGNTFSYSLVAGTGSSDNASFTISGNALLANSSFDFEAKSSYSIRIRSVDQGGLFVDKVFQITVTNVNEAPTDIGLSSTTVDENLAANTSVATLSTTDPDAGDSFTYALVTGTGAGDNSSFAIAGNSLVANQPFNFESRSTYLIRLRSTDRSGLSVEKAFVISIRNVNESPSDINLSSTNLLADSGANAVVGIFSTVDPDANNSFVYSLVAGTGSTNNQSFNVSGNTLRATASLSVGSYSIRVRSTDQGGLSFEKAFSISVVSGNSAPTDLSLSPTSLQENLGINASVGSLSTTDPNLGDTFTYSFATGPGSDDNAVFRIVGSTLIALLNFDFETKSTYSVRVRSTDQGGLFVEKQITVNVLNVNEQPTDIGLSPAVVGELKSRRFAVGTPFVDAIFSDLNNDGILDAIGLLNLDGGLRVMLGDSSGNLLSPTNFGLSGSSYHLAAADLNGDGKVDVAVTQREENRIAVLLGNGTGALSTAQFYGMPNAPLALTLGDLNKDGRPDIISANQGVNNNPGSIGVLISQASGGFAAPQTYPAAVWNAGVVAGDFNRDGNLDVASAGEFSSQVDIYFGNGNGALNLAQTLRAIPRRGSYGITAGDFTGDGILDLATNNVSDNTVSILRGTSSGAFQVQSVLPTGAYPYSITASDLNGDGKLDVVVPNQNESTLGVMLGHGDGTFDPERKFNASGGGYYVASGDLNRDGSTDLLMSSLQGLELFSGRQIPVGSVTTLDPDSGSSFTYTLVTGQGSQDNLAFKIVGDSLVSTLNLPVGVYSVRVRSTDQGGLSTEKQLTVTVTAGNVAPVDIALSSSTIVENSPSNSVVGTFSTIDSNQGNSFVYSLVTGVGSIDNSSFTINGNTLIALSGFDFESKNSYAIRVRSTDQGGLFFEKSFTISVTNLNEAPVFNSSSYTFSLLENALPGSTVGTIKATDPDVGSNLSYSISGTGASNFVVNTTTGDVTVASNATFDATLTPRFNLLATVTDGAISATVPLSINVQATVAVVNTDVFYRGSAFAAGGVDNAIDPSKDLARSGNTPLTLNYSNLINTTFGLNGLVIDIARMPGTSLSVSDFVFRMSPQGLFNATDNPPSSWATAPAPSGIFVTPATATTPARVRIEWVNNAIANRWLQLQVLNTANTGLTTTQVYYVGHLAGEIDGRTIANAYFVSNSDLVLVNPIGVAATVDNPRDLDKNRFVLNSDGIAIRNSVVAGLALRNLTIPIAGSAAEGRVNTRSSINSLAPSFITTPNRIPGPERRDQRNSGTADTSALSQSSIGKSAASATHAAPQRFEADSINRKISRSRLDEVDSALSDFDYFELLLDGTTTGNFTQKNA